MQGLHRSICAVVWLAVIAWPFCAHAGNPQLTHLPSQPQNGSAARRVEFNLELISAEGLMVSEFILYEPGASFVKPHFAMFKLPTGMLLEVSNPDGTERYRYSQHKRDGYTFDPRQGDDGTYRFSSMSISGDTAIIRVLGPADSLRHGVHGLRIDHYLLGAVSPELPTPPLSFLEASGKTPVSRPQTNCGINQRYDAVCWKDSHPSEYDRSMPVAALITSTGEECTAWRVGPDNRLFTAQHCLSSQADVTGSEVWFNYQKKSCGGSSTETVVKVSGNELLTTDTVLDFGLFSVNNFSSISAFGYLGLEVRDASQGETIYIPQHGLGKPKQIALESDMNGSGLCEIDSANHNGYGPGTDVGYYCDTTTSSSGSPVIAGSSGKVLALHHLGGCLNSGSKMKLIWPKVSAFFGGTVPSGDGSSSGGSNRAPTARFDFNCNGLVCDFDGSDSSDPDGSLTAYNWDFGDGSVASGVTASHTFSAAGSFNVSLSVRDDAGSQRSTTKTVTVNVPNQPPTAQFSTSCVELQCSFNASSSSDPDGSISSYTWTLGDGTTATGLQVDHGYASPGTYTIKLTVKDDDNATASRTKSVTVNVANIPPVAEFSSSCDGLVCSFDARASSDADGSIVQYAWTLGDGNTSQGAQISHSYGSSGAYTIKLTVTDDRGANSSKTRSVSLGTPNQAPTADFTVSCDANLCQFSAAASSDPDGSITRYDWNLGDGSQASGISLTHSYAQAGTRQVTLEVEDNKGAVDSRQKSIVVHMPDEPTVNVPPLADIWFDCTFTTCRFNAGNSSDSDGHITKYHWDLDDGSTATGMQVDHEFSTPGSYRVRLVVTDNQGAQSDATAKVVVSSSSHIRLSAKGLLFKNKLTAMLNWSGAQSSQVDVYRNGKLVSSVPNRGLYAEQNLKALAGKSTSYRICEADSSVCSADVAIKTVY